MVSPIFTRKPYSAANDLSEIVKRKRQKAAERARHHRYYESHQNRIRGDRMRTIDADELITLFPLGEFIRTECVRAIIYNMPTIEPQRMRGRWIDDGQYSDNFPHHAWRCSECGESVIEIDTPWYRYCPNCGAWMVESQESEVKKCFQDGKMRPTKN